MNVRFVKAPFDIYKRQCIQIPFLLHHNIILACAYVYDEGKGAQWDMDG